jgi:hypothetical protein
METATGYRHIVKMEGICGGVDGKNRLDQTGYGIRTNPCPTPLASKKIPVISPLALMASASVPVESGASNVVMAPLRARTNP